MQKVSSGLGPVSTINLVEGAATHLACLRALEQKILWLSVWMIHHANHLRPKTDGLKVGGHQASSASVVTLMTALYFDVLRPQDRVAVKPHASPVFHAIQYLFGRQTRQKLERFRALWRRAIVSVANQGYRRRRFLDRVRRVGVGCQVSALVQQYVRDKDLIDHAAAPGRMIALLGDAEFDEGNVFEAMLEGWKHDVRDVWWIVDYNRQSLDNVTADQLVHRLDAVFRSMGWSVVTLKYGRLLERAFRRKGGDALRDWLDACPNARYSHLAHAGGATWRQSLRTELGDTSGIRELLDDHDDDGLQDLMTNLAGHDVESVLDAFHAASEDQPSCFIAYPSRVIGCRSKVTRTTMPAC